MFHKEQTLSRIFVKVEEFDAHSTNHVFLVICSFGIEKCHYMEDRCRI